jgi:hypothetical protein
MVFSVGYREVNIDNLLPDRWQNQNPIGDNRNVDIAENNAVTID